MRALNHLLELPALQLVSGSLVLLAAAMCAAIIVFMVGFRLVGMPSGAVWVLLGLVRMVPVEHDASLDDALERENRAETDSSESTSLKSLGRKVTAAGAGRPVKASRRSKKKSASLKSKQTSAR